MEVFVQRWEVRLSFEIEGVKGWTVTPPTSATSFAVGGAKVGEGWAPHGVDAQSALTRVGGVGGVGVA